MHKEYVVCTHDTAGSFGWKCRGRMRKLHIFLIDATVFISQHISRLLSVFVCQYASRLSLFLRVLPVFFVFQHPIQLLVICLPQAHTLFFESL